LVKLVHIGFQENKQNGVKKMNVVVDKRILENKDLMNELDSHGLIDLDDGQVWASMMVNTCDTAQDFIDGCESCKPQAAEIFGGVKVTVLAAYQIRKGNQRTKLFHLDFQDGSQNTVFVM
jgi:hypothetical protein